MNNQKQQRHHLRPWVKVALLISFLIGFIWIYYEFIIQSQNDRVNENLSPIIMIPGSGVNNDRFDKTVEKINQDSSHKHSLIKVKVMRDNQVKISGKLKHGDLEPFIVIGFQNNQDGYQNIKLQGKSLSNAFDALETQYHFGSFSMVGHSNGGLIWTYWLEHGYRDFDNIRTRTLLTIGSPFNFEENSRQHETLMLHEMIINKKKLPQNLNVFSIGGANSYESDGLVPTGSYISAKYVFQKQVKHFTMIELSGSDSEHSDLPTNSQVISIIEEHVMQDHAARMRAVEKEN